MIILSVVKYLTLTVQERFVLSYTSQNSGIHEFVCLTIILLILNALQYMCELVTMSTVDFYL